MQPCQCTKPRSACRIFVVKLVSFSGKRDFLPQTFTFNAVTEARFRIYRVTPCAHENRANAPVRLLTKGFLVLAEVLQGPIHEAAYLLLQLLDCASFFGNTPPGVVDRLTDLLVDPPRAEQISESFSRLFSGLRIGEVVRSH